MDEKPIIIKRDIKYPRIEMKTGNLILILPKERKISIEDFLKKHQKWIKGKRELIEKVKRECEKEKLVERKDEDFYKLVENFTKEFSQKLKIKIPKIQFRLMKTKWGSYTKKNRIILNPILKFLPESLIRYVVFHEFCHLIISRHNKKFWLLISKEFDDSEVLERKLLGYWFLIWKMKGRGID